MSLTETRTRVISLVVGPGDHGVVRHAMAVGAAAGVKVARFPGVPTAAELAALPGDATVAHLHYTDRLFGPDAATAAARVRDLAIRLERRLVIGLHDVPVLDGTPHSTLRVTAYRLVAGCADVVLVASNHERDRLYRCGIDADIGVVPLPIDCRGVLPAAQETGAVHGRTVGVLGFIYPGKGHEDVIEASSTLPSDVAVHALGAPSDGHADLVGTLARLATRRGRRFAVTGRLDDATLALALRRVDVPVVPGRTMSASASLGEWIGAGRRPIVASNDYTREVAAAAPGLMTMYDPKRPGQLSAALRAALNEPPSTWHAGHVPEVYSPDHVGRSHRRLYHHVATRR